jgi:pyridoxamine 5'-phosphate oxidase
MSVEALSTSGSRARLARRDERSRPSEDPIARFQKLFERARHAAVPQPEAMALATAERQGRVSVRFVLLKQADERGFVFYTDKRSRKGRELEHNPRAAAVFYWHALAVQVRIEGRVEPISPAEADEYWASRPRTSRLAASVSRQSSRLSSRERLLADFTALQNRLKGKVIPRPKYWIGFRITPDLIEFWTARPHRLHDRLLFVRSRDKWEKRLLYP